MVVTNRYMFVHIIEILYRVMKCFKILFIMPSYIYSRGKLSNLLYIVYLLI